MPSPGVDRKNEAAVEAHNEDDDIVNRGERVTYLNESQEDFDDADIEEPEDGGQNAKSVMDVATGYVHWAALDNPTPKEQKALLNSSFAIGAVLVFAVTGAMMIILAGVYVVAEIRSN